MGSFQRFICQAEIIHLKSWKRSENTLCTKYVLQVSGHILNEHFVHWEILHAVNTQDDHAGLSYPASILLILCFQIYNSTY